MSTLWHADHIFLHPGPESDHFLVQYVEPYLRHTPAVRAWFFIRYREGGSHLRIRIAADPATCAQAAHHWRQCTVGFSKAASANLDLSEAMGPHIPPGNVLTIPYEPETERYGGELAIPIAERTFCRSTALALRILSATPTNPAARIGQALRLMLVSASVLTPDQSIIGQLFRTYAEGWRSHFAKYGWEAGDPPVSVIDPDAIRLALIPDNRRTFGSAWRNCLITMMDELKTAGPLTASLEDVVLSQMHMLCNRLDISPTIELHLAEQIGRIL